MKNQKVLNKVIAVLFITALLSPLSSVSFASKADPIAQFLGVTCGVPEDAGYFFQEGWEEIYNTLPVADDETVPWDTPKGNNVWGPNPSDWGDWQNLAFGSLLQNDPTPNQLSLLLETNRWMGDGTIETCFQFVSAPNGVIPGGVVFRYKDKDNFYGFGFLDEDTVALGAMVNGFPVELARADGYSATQANHVKISLSGNNINIFLNDSEVFNIDSGVRTEGMFGYGTYGSSAYFGSIWADYDCSWAEANLSHIGQAVLTEVSPQSYCNNQYQELVYLPDPSGGNPLQKDAFLKFADLITTAKYEVAFTAMLWDEHSEDNEYPSSGMFLLGGENQLGGLRALYELTQNPATSDNYPQGMRVRILLGYDEGQVLNVDEVLKILNVPYTASIGTDGREWRIEIGYYRYGKFKNTRHSHVKTLIVDGRHVIATGYNVNNWYSNGVADMGISVSGPVAFESQLMFDALWKDAGVYCDSSPCDWTTEEYPDYSPRHLSAVTLGNDNVFALFRDKDNKEADNAISAALENATDEVNIIQQRFGLGETGLVQLPFATALENAITNNSSLNVRLLISSNSGTSSIPFKWFGDLYNSRKGIEALLLNLGNIGREDQFSVKYYHGGLHTKALSIDEKFLIVGSQNWDASAWGNGGMDLVEFSLGLDGGTLPGVHPAIASFEQHFDNEWSSGEAINWVDDIYQSIDTALPNEILFPATGVLETPSTLDVDIPLVLVGGGPSSVIAFVDSTPPPSGDPEPLLRITSSDVAVVGFTFKDAPGYAIEIGDGSGTPLENIFISNVIFENNALGGIKINAPSDGSALTYHIENNVFMGGEVGILIDVAPAQAENSVVRNNIFTEQTTVPIEVISTDDGGVAYTYNLFDNCIRATDGICPSDWLTGTMNANSIAEQNIFNLSPAFSDAANGDYSLSANSPAIDAGDPAISYEEGALDGDEDGTVRIDMGAVEYFPDEANPRQLVLLSPQPGEIVGQVNPILSWEWAVESPPAPASYRVQASTDAQFLTTIVDEQAVTESTLQLPALTKGIYYWRVSPDAGTTWSLVRQFVISDPPVVSSITRADPNPTNVQSVDFTIVFSDDVTGVDASDFTLTTTGTISGASISEITGANSTYTASVDTGTGDGTIRLDLIDNDTIANIYGMPLGGAGIVNGDYTAGEEYSVGPPPDNDDFNSPKDISALAYSHQMSTAYATIANDDPLVTACGIEQGQTTVWYSYTPSADSAISIDTFSADYDTFIAVWTGTRGDLTLIACNDDANETGQSALAFQVDQDVTYYIEIGQP